MQISFFDQAQQQFPHARTVIIDENQTKYGFYSSQGLSTEQYGGEPPTPKTLTEAIKRSEGVIVKKEKDNRLLFNFKLRDINNIPTKCLVFYQTSVDPNFVEFENQYLRKSNASNEHEKAISTISSASHILIPVDKTSEKQLEKLYENLRGLDAYTRRAISESIGHPSVREQILTLQRRISYLESWHGSSIGRLLRSLKSLSLSFRAHGVFTVLSLIIIPLTVVLYIIYFLHYATPTGHTCELNSGTSTSSVGRISLTDKNIPKSSEDINRQYTKMVKHLQESKDKDIQYIALKGWRCPEGNLHCTFTLEDDTSEQIKNAVSSLLRIALLKEVKLSHPRQPKYKYLLNNDWLYNFMKKNEKNSNITFISDIELKNSKNTRSWYVGKLDLGASKKKELFLIPRIACGQQKKRHYTFIPHKSSRASLRIRCDELSSTEVLDSINQFIRFGKEAAK